MLLATRYIWIRYLIRRLYQFWFPKLLQARLRLVLWDVTLSAVKLALRSTVQRIDGSNFPRRSEQPKRWLGFSYEVARLASACLKPWGNQIQFTGNHLRSWQHEPRALPISETIRWDKTTTICWLYKFPPPPPIFLGIQQ